MIDINNIVNTAIAQEINKAITNYVDAYMANVQQEHRNEIRALEAQIACMEEDLAKLKQQRADSPAPAFTGQEVTALQLCITHETSPIYSAICEIAHNAAVAVAEEVMSSHLEGYDHDDYDRALTTIEDANLDSLPDFDDFVKHDDLPDFDDFVKEEEMHGAIEEKINDLVDVDTLVTKDDVFEAVRTEVRNTIDNHLSISVRLD